MAKNDMEVIMYKILRYMYECMKVGKRLELLDMCYKCKMFEIPELYWNQIILELIEAGYVRGFLKGDTKDGLTITMLDSAAITLEGVRFLEENSRMVKSRQFLGKGFEVALDTILKAL
ncbi:MAG: YjcQ family protein [Anaerostipes sp.]|nr:YjcQ family protein [Anaerostipes sp.]